MPSYSFEDEIKDLRERKKWMQAVLAGNDMEGEGGFKAPTEALFCPYLEEQPIDSYEKRDQIINLLNSDSERDWDMAEGLIMELERREGFDLGINRQFVLSVKAQLHELRLLDPAHSLLMVQTGLFITYPEFDERNFEGDIFFFEEPNLVHMMALSYYRAGMKTRAINLLRRIAEGFARLLEDAREGERKLAPVLLSLAEILVREEEYVEALGVCEIGADVSNKRNKGRYTPDFLYKMAVCARSLGDLARYRCLLQQVYFGYILLRKTEQAKRVLDAADVEFSTYGVENLVYREQTTGVSHGGMRACSSVGLLLAVLRQEAGLSQTELCKGICGQSTLNRIESGRIQGNVYYLEAFMQRLGRDPNKYFNTFPSEDDFNAKQIRDEINAYVANLNYGAVSELLVELKKSKSFCGKKPGQQFILRIEAILFGSREGYGNPKYLEMLNEAIEVTKPGFDESSVDRQRLTYTETSVINQIAMHYCNAGDMTRGLRLFERLLESMDRYYVDEHEKMLLYTTILYNYSKHLGRRERYIEALEVVDKGEALSVKHNQLILLPNFAINRACDLLETGKKEESVPYFAMGYYGSVMLGEKNNCSAIAAYVKERLGIEFD